MGTLLQDLRYGVRTLLRNPGFTAVAVISLALGIGANTTIFSVVNALLFRPLPVENPGQLVDIYTSDFSGPAYGSSSYPDIVDFRQRNNVFSSMTAFSILPMNMSGRGATERIWGVIATGDYFTTLGLRPAAGRLLTSDDDNERGAEAVAVISHGYWTRRFAGDPSVVGQKIVLNGHPFTVVGVAPRGFTGTMNLFTFDVWTPMMMQEQLQQGRRALDSRGSRWLLAFGRLKDGETADRARQVFGGVARQLHDEHPNEWTDLRKQPRRITVEPASGMPFLAGNRKELLGAVTLLMVVVGGVLLIACANVASMLMARAAARSREMGIRVSIGAGRSRLVRQLLTESALLAILGGAAALLLTLWTTAVLSRFQPPMPFPIELNFNPDWRVLAFAAGVSVATAVAFGLAPALTASQANPMSALRESALFAGRGSGLLRRILVTAQFAVACLLLIGSGLFLRSLMNAQAIDIGFRNRDILIVATDLALQGYNDAQGRLFQQQLLEEVRATAGVRGTALAEFVPLGFGGSRIFVKLEGYQPRPGEDMELHYNTVGPDYFHVMGIDLVRGRAFTDGEGPGSPPVVIVSEALARRYWRELDPIGKRITRGQRVYEVVGVARDGKYVSLSEETLPCFYLSIVQNYEPATLMLVRTSGRPKDALGAVSGVLRKLDKDLPMYYIKSMDEHLALSLLPARLIGWLLGIFGGVALALAVIGVYGLMSYSVSQRTREVGVRIALGARPSSVLVMILRQGMRVAAAGLAIGTLAAIGLTRFAASLLYNVSPTDAATFLTAIALMGAAALLACSIPARRAARVEPTVALRYD